MRILTAIVSRDSEFLNRAFNKNLVSHLCGNESVTETLVHPNIWVINVSGCIRRKKHSIISVDRTVR